MRLQASLLLALVGAVDGFAPRNFGVRPNTARLLGADPSILNELPNQVLSLHDAFTSISLSDALDSLPNPAGLVDAVAGAPSALADTVQSVPPPDVSAAADVVEQSDNGWFGFLTGPTQGLLQLIHNVFVGVGMSSDAWGVSIIALTIVIKIVTFPLTKTQLESTNKVQALQPTIKALQAKYESNPEVMNQKIAEIYQTNQVNPLAGCLPSLVQIPIFIGLYRAVLDLAKENKLDEPFLWLPNLEGPVYGADPTHGSDWLFNWVDGSPPLGWDDTAAFLILPVLLVVSQFVSMELMTPKNQEQQSNFVLKLLPLLIGWFSLNVPAALCLYWFTNNLVTTATSLLIRNNMTTEPVITPGGGAAAASTPPPSSVFAPPPMREKPAGFATPTISEDDVTPITAAASAPVVDAEIVDQWEDESGESAPPTPDTSTPKKPKRKKRKKKRN